MKILLMYPPAAAISRGGLWTQVEKSAEALRSRGVEVDMTSPGEGTSLTSYDLCHIVGANMATYHVARELHRRNVPFVVSPVFFSLHSPAFLRGALRAYRMLRRFVKGVWMDYGYIADVCSWSRAVLPNTRAEGELLQEGFAIDRGKITVIPNGVDGRFYTARPDAFRERYGGDDFVLTVGYFGRGRKNTLGLIRALGKMGLRGIIIGGAEDPAYFDLCSREAGKNPKILIIPGLPAGSDLLASAYAACRVFVLPSLYETPGIAALEAGLAGANIVITKHGGTTEYFGSWAEYVEPRSEQSIIDGTRKAWEKGRTSDLREHIRQNYVWDRIGGQLLEAYRSALKSVR